MQCDSHRRKHRLDTSEITQHCRDIAGAHRDGAGGLREHCDVHRPAAAADRAAAAVEERERHAVLLRDRHQLLLRLVQRPVRREPARVLRRVRVPQHHLLHVAPTVSVASG